MQPFGEPIDEKALQGLAHGRRGTGGPDCPPAEEWARLPAGLVAARSSEWMLQHAAGCDACGELLRIAAEAVANESEEEDTRVFEALASAKPEWQRAMADRMRKSGAGQPRWPYAAIAAAIVVTVGVASWAILQRQSNTPERLLARAYTAKRAFEFRLPDAGHAPVRVERQGTSTFSRPPELLEAQALISRELTQHGDDPRWLALQGRAELLESHYEAAIGAFERALDARPGDAQLLAELACAKAVRGDAEHRAVDYAAAFELLSQSLEKRPNALDALFNRALVAERSFLYDQAIQDWNRLLQLEPRGAWAEEAGQRLAAVEQKKKSAR